MEPIVQKLWRSNHHLTRLHEAISEYLDLEPYVAVVEDQPERKGYQTTFKLKVPPPPRIALIAGDALNNLHGTLDYLAWQLVRAAPAIPGRPTSFPILLPKDNATLPPVEILDTNGTQAISDQRVLDALDEVQPYQDGDNARNHPLFVLARLNRETKHRHLPLLVTNVPSFAIGGMNLTGPETLPKKMPLPPALGEENDEKVGFSPYPDEGEPRVPKHIKVSPAVALKEIGSSAPYGPSLWDTVVSIYDRISSDVLPRFQPFLDG